jgi:poly-gamma-glutamate synthesis protein (capsule biosynthesis protein)
VGNGEFPKYYVVVFALLLAACGQVWEPMDQNNPPLSTANVAPKATLTPYQPEANNPVTSATPSSPTGDLTPTSMSQSIWISPAAPDLLRQLALGTGLTQAASPDEADAHLDVSQINNDQTITWIYALVAPFPTTTDNVELQMIQNAWAGRSSGAFKGKPLWMTSSTLAAFSAIWGPPANGAVNIAGTNRLVDKVWSDRPSWAIVPFEELEPRWKVLSVDGQSPLHNDFDAEAYGLKVKFNVQPTVIQLVPSNRDPDKLTVLAMTGVTALVRATADRMVTHGILYPGEQIRSVLRSADLTHVSNEVSFYEDCPVPDPWTSSLQFCSDPRNIGLLEDIGVDIVELTGNHLLDYGPGPLLTTLDMYDQRGWLYFGGGRNLADARQAVEVTNHGNNLAFLGCNPVGPESDWATDTSPGSASCDYEQMKTEIASLKAQGYLPIMTFQYNEYYQPFPTDYEQRDFRSMADAGAIIVSGSQAHVPAAMEIYNGAFIHYGLGNLFFDQMSHQMPDGTVIHDTRNVFVDRHIFYNGRYLGTELLTFIIEDYAQPRPMTETERTNFLLKIFSAAGW